MPRTRRTVHRDEVDISVTDLGGTGRPVVILHGLAGSSREMLPTAMALEPSHHVALVDQRGHGHSTRRPDDLSREAFVDDVIGVLDELFPEDRVSLVGQSMGAHTAFLAAARRPDRVDRLVMLEGHVAGSARHEDADEIGAFFESWPVPFADQAAAHEFLGDSPLTDAWIRDLDRTSDGLVPRFDADVMRQTIAAVHAPRWAEWEGLRVPTMAIFAENGIFSPEQKDDLIRRRPATRRGDIEDAGHDAHLDAFDRWMKLLHSALGD